MGEDKDNGRIGVEPGRDRRWIGFGILVVSLVLIAQLVGCFDLVGGQNDETWKLDDVEPLDLEDCNFVNPFGDEERDIDSIAVTGSDDLVEFADYEEFCLDGTLWIDDDTGELSSLEPLYGVEYIHRLVFGADLINVCAEDDPVQSGCREEAPESANGQLESLGELRSLRRVDSLSLIVGGGFDDLNGLQRLQEVDSNLSIGDAWPDDVPRVSVRSLRGLDNLESIGGSLRLGGWSELRSLDGLEGLREIGNDLEIRNHRDLEDISALYGVESIGGDVRVGGNMELDQCAGAELVEEIGRQNIGGDVQVGC